MKGLPVHGQRTKQIHEHDAEIRERPQDQEDEQLKIIYLYGKKKVLTNEEQLIETQNRNLRRKDRDSAASND
jgi:hypothetical protein